MTKQIEGLVARPAVEDFMRLCSPANPFWGMADSDVLDLCNYILHLEANARAKTDEGRNSQTDSREG